MKKQTTDITLLFVTILLLGIGITMVYSSSSEIARENFNVASFIFKKQFLRMTVGVLFMLVLMKINYKIFKPLAVPLLILGVIGLMILAYMKFINFHQGVRGSMRWLNLGLFKIQPSELVKLFMIFLLSSVFSRINWDIRDLKHGFVPLVIIVFFVVGLVIIQPDFSMALTIAVLSLLMMYYGGARVHHILGAVSITFVCFLIKALRTPYVINRMFAWFHPAEHTGEAGYQLSQSLIGLGMGGIFGVGLGEGIQQSWFLPEPHTDFVFTIIGEEIGFVGAFTVLILFLVYLWRGIVIALSAQDEFGYYLAAGITTMVGLGAFVNIGVVMGVLPTTGMALPFISYGGTSLVLNLSATGILLSIGSRGYGRKSFTPWARTQKSTRSAPMRYSSRGRVRGGIHIRH